MSPSHSQNPWPAQTDPPTVPSPSRSKRKRQTIYARQSRGSTSLVMSRQIVADSPQIAQAKLNCMWKSGNDVISCFPTSDTMIPQHQWATFVWNSRRPEITQTNLVDIYLFHGDSQEQIYHWHNVMNPTDQAGSITAQVNDTWFGNPGLNWNGSNTSYPYYWVLTRSDKTLDGSEIPQATFSAVQTTFADSVASSMASSSSLSMASASSAASASASASAAGAHPSNGPGNVQSGLGGSSFPHWAIAVIAVLGFLALAAICVFVFLIMRRMRPRKKSSNRNSMSSSSPMMQHIQDNNRPPSPIMDGVGGVVGARATSSHGHQSLTSHDASTVSRAPSSDQGPFSGADAAIMADAFRKALRKPDFAGQPVEEGDSPPEEIPDEALINRELAEEGRDIRSVDSSRGVTVESTQGGRDLF